MNGHAHIKKKHMIFWALAIAFCVWTQVRFGILATMISFAFIAAPIGIVTSMFGEHDEEENER